MTHPIENVGPKFTKEGMLLAREKTWAVIEKVRTSLTPGILETEATALTEKILTENGSERRWHRSWVRFGENTLLPYGKLSKPETRLRENDIFFLDLGPVFGDFEGDAGATYTIGNHPEQVRCAKDVRTVFDLTKNLWMKDRVTGKDLYHFAEKTAKDLGWIFSLEGASGHRLSDFPHTLHHKGPITALDFSPSELLWVLEIQIRHAALPFGAFYEDLMVPKTSESPLSPQS